MSSNRKGGAATGSVADLLSAQFRHSSSRAGSTAGNGPKQATTVGSSSIAAVSAGWFPTFPQSCVTESKPGWILRAGWGARLEAPLPRPLSLFCHVSRSFCRALDRTPVVPRRLRARSILRARNGPVPSTSVGPQRHRQRHQSCCLLCVARQDQCANTLGLETSFNHSREAIRAKWLPERSGGAS